MSFLALVAGGEKQKGHRIAFIPQGLPQGDTEKVARATLVLWLQAKPWLGSHAAEGAQEQAVPMGFP